MEDNVTGDDSLLTNEEVDGAEKKYTKFGLGFRLMASFGAVAAMTVIVSAISWFSMGNLISAQSSMTEEKVPAISLALNLANDTNLLAATAPQLSNAKSGDERMANMQSLQQTVTGAQNRLTTLNQYRKNDPRLESIASDLQSLTPLFSQLDNLVQERHRLSDIQLSLASQLTGMRENLEKNINPLLLPLKISMLDNAGAWEELLESSIETALAGTEPEYDTAELDSQARGILDFQRSILEFKNYGYFMIGILAEGIQATDKEHVTALESLFLEKIASMATPLYEINGRKENEQLTLLFDQLLKLGSKGELEEQVFKLRIAQIEAQEKANNILAQSRTIAAALGQSAGEFVTDVKASVQTAASENLVLADQTRITLIICTLIALAVAVAIGWLYVGRNIINRLMQLLSSMQTLSQGDLEASINREGRDEIARMGEALAILRNVYREAENLKAQQEENDIKNAKENRAVELKLADDFDATVGSAIESLSKDVGQMRQQSDMMHELTTKTQSDAAAISESSGVMSNDMSTVAATTEELSSSVNEISAQVGRSTEISREAVDRAQEMNGNIHRLEQGSKKIEDVISLISTIAEQTNLLALNATIEAARAGDAGKGFAVVANEVKSLANQTTNATEEISTLIASIQKEIIGAVDGASRIDKVIGQFDEISFGISAAVEEQGAATQEISRTVSQTAKYCSNVAEQVETVSIALNETNRVMGEVVAGTNRIDEQSVQVSEEVTNFLSNIREKS